MHDATEQVKELEGRFALPLHCAVEGHKLKRCSKRASMLLCVLLSCLHGPGSRMSTCMCCDGQNAC